MAAQQSEHCDVEFDANGFVLVPAYGSFTTRNGKLEGLANEDAGKGDSGNASGAQA